MVGWTLSAEKVGVVSFECIEDQRLVSLGGDAAMVGQIKFRCNGLHAQTRQLRVHLDVHRFVWLHSNDKLVTRGVFEDTRCDVFELNADFGFLLVES